VGAPVFVPADLLHNRLVRLEMASLINDSGALLQPSRSVPPTTMNSGRGVLDTLSTAYSGTSSWAQESARFSLHQLPGPEPVGWRFTPTAPPSFNDASAAICDGASEDLVISMLRYNPTLATQKNKYGVTLLHWAAYYCAPPSVVRALVAANADAARQATTSDGCLPLHIGAAWNLSPAGLAIIFAAFPDALQKLDANGLTPAEKAERAGHSAVGAVLRDREKLLHALTSEDTRGKIITAIVDKARGPKTTKGPRHLTIKHADRIAALQIELERLDLTKLRHRAIAAGIDPRTLGTRPPQNKTASDIAQEIEAKLASAAGAVGGGKTRRTMCEECGFAAATHCHKDDPKHQPRWCTGCATDGPTGIPSAVPLPSSFTPTPVDEATARRTCSNPTELLLRDHKSYQARIRTELAARKAAEARVLELEATVAGLQRQLKDAGQREQGLVRTLDLLAARDAEGVRSDNDWWGERDVRSVGEQIALLRQTASTSRDSEKLLQQHNRRK
jgi:hypothetical protein